MPQIASIGRGIAGYVPEAAALPVPRAALDVAVPIGVVAEAAAGYPGRPGLVGARPDGSGWAPRFVLDDAQIVSDRAADIHLADEVAALGLTLRLRVDDVLTIGATLRNEGTSAYGVQRLAVSVPLPAHCRELVTFEGRWCREFQPRRSAFEGTTSIENRTGRTSHARMPAMFAGVHGFGEQAGEVWGIQLAWSGNYELAAERLPDGRRHVQAGELLAPGEVELDPGASYDAPDVVVAWSEHGLTGASQAFHRYTRARLPTVRTRPVTLNTWEAVYFDHRIDTLQRLADAAADVGIERFVLDDGWFGGRRDDTAGLGDWWVSTAVWPSGLGPIVDHVRSLGMEFGLWVEPEMVNPDSDLYRAHPEWTLTTSGYEPILGRQQLVLDLGRPEVGDFLFASFDALLREYDIAALKWDMNRDVVQGSREGRCGVHGHVRGVYALIDRLRVAHPELEIESCASGGGRADLGILTRTDRVWTSDCNDAVERQQIQRGFTMLFPPEVMGAHVGPERAHTTGRRHDLGFRASTALFGHLGVEWNLLEATPAERTSLAAAIGVHKRLRPLLHGGRVVRVDHPDSAALVHGVVAPDASHAVFAYVQLTSSATTVPSPARFPGLDADRTYRIEVLTDVSPAKEGGRTPPAWLGQPLDVSGEQLIQRGLQLPILLPESALLLELRTVH